jgi:adenosylmethionine---8-amino-7-oxononanoate aminotransferase
VNVRLSPVWHPFTQHALRPRLPTVARAEGAYLFTPDGRRIFDAISSWWVTTHGHCHPRIVAAIQRAASTLDQVIFAEFTHEAAERVAARLVELTAPSLQYVFFSDSGSTSVEVALKMALGFWRHNGDSRNKIVVLEHGYHGDTIGAMSASARGPFTDPYEPLLFDVARIPFPAAGFEERTLDAFGTLCRGGEIAALLIEPLVLGAGGMLMYSPAVLAALRRVCTEHGALFIADEVMTGWGRTGTMFACEQAGVSPDIACYSKGLTGGSLPLAATLCSPEIFRAHYDTDRRRTFFHSSSFTANPIACAAAFANLEIWATEPVKERIAALAGLHSCHLQRFRDDRRFENVRQTGTIAAVDLKAEDPGYFATIGLKLQERFRESGVLLRPLGNTIYIMPPYCTSGDDLEQAYSAIESAVATSI